MMTPSELLERLALTLKNELGPNIEAEYPRTQAYLGAVVLQKLSKQLRLENARKQGEASDRQALQNDLEKLLDDIEAPPTVLEAVSALPDDGDAGLCHLIETLYAERDRLGEAGFAALLGRVRRSLRRTLDRQMEYAS